MIFSVTHLTYESWWSKSGFQTWTFVKHKYQLWLKSWQVEYSQYIWNLQNSMSCQMDWRPGVEAVLNSITCRSEKYDNWVENNTSKQGLSQYNQRVRQWKRHGAWWCKEPCETWTWIPSLEVKRLHFREYDGHVWEPEQWAWALSHPRPTAKHVTLRFCCWFQKVTTMLVLNVEG